MPAAVYPFDLSRASILSRYAAGGAFLLVTALKVAKAFQVFVSLVDVGEEARDCEKTEHLLRRASSQAVAVKCVIGGRDAMRWAQAQRRAAPTDTCVCRGDKCPVEDRAPGRPPDQITRSLCMLWWPWDARVLRAIVPSSACRAV
jgi:hypothetical protein